MKLTMSSWEDGDGRWGRSRVAIQRQSTALVEETVNRGRGRGNPLIMEPEQDPARARAGRIAAGIEVEEFNGRCLLALAGGRGWSAGRPVGFHSGGAAARAGRYLWQLRGVKPSETSLEEGASAATAAMALTVRCWDKVKPEHWQNGRLARFLFRVGWRAAFQAIVANGFTGDKATDNVSTLPLSAGALEVERASLQAWAEQSGVTPDTAQDEARRAVAAFVWRGLVSECGRKNKTALRAVRQRARLLIRLVYGHRLPDAARLAGFASARAAIESMRSGKVFSTLATAATSRSSRLPGMAQLAQSARQAGQSAGQAVKAQRGLDVLHWPCLWLAAVERRGAAVDWARFCQSRLKRARAEQVRAWQSAVSGWRRGWLR